MFPFGSASTVDPLEGAVEESSTSRVVREPGVPLKSEEGRKRSLVLLARKRALSSSRPEVAMEFQVLDPLACHCQTPSVEESAALAVMTTPARESAEEPPVTASVASEKLEAKREETVSPLGSEESSSTAVSEAEPEVATGASLTALMEVPRETD